MGSSLRNRERREMEVIRSRPPKLRFLHQQRRVTNNAAIQTQTSFGAFPSTPSGVDSRKISRFSRRYEPEELEGVMLRRVLVLLSGPVLSEVRPSTFPSLDRIRAAMSFVKCRYAQGRRCQLAGLLIASILGSPMLAAAQATSGVMTGVITDAQSAVLPGVTLTLRN